MKSFLAVISSLAILAAVAVAAREGKEEVLANCFP